METVAHHGRETAYRLAGEGDARVLYVHGSGATHRLWVNQYGPDGPVRPAAALDLSGHGDSDDVDTEPGPATLEAYAEDVVAVARASGADVLVGNSLGGAVVQHVAIETDHDLAGLVLAGTGAKLAVQDDLRGWLVEDFERAVEFLHGDDLLFHDADERTVERSKSEMRATGQAVTRRDFRTCHRFDVRDRIHDIGVPVLAVVGEYDRLTPPSYHEFLAERVPSGEYAEVADAAHLAMLERPERFDDHVGTFLDRHGIETG